VEGLRTVLLGVLPLLLAACSGASTSPYAELEPPADIVLTPLGDGWQSRPVRDGLNDVSNDGFGYTGEIHFYRVVAPAAGRMQVSLSWRQAADYDLIVAADAAATLRLAEGLHTGSAPECVKLDVVAGQELYVMVAGWAGDTGSYELETIILPPDVPVFEIVETDDLSIARPRNLPIRFTFSQRLDPSQPVKGRVAIVTTGHGAEGEWCIDGRDLLFYPRPPEWPGDDGGLIEGDTYEVQFAFAADGVRAESGEFLADLALFKFGAGPLVDEAPHTAPAVTDIDIDPAKPWDGLLPLTLTFNSLLDPDTVVVKLETLDAAGAVTGSLPVRLTLRQIKVCVASHLVLLEVQPIDPLPSNTTLLLSVPATVRGISGEPRPANLLRPFSVQLSTP
jgi:hypothetical protein